MQILQGFKKGTSYTDSRALQQFLLVYRITPNPNTPMGCSPAETMFARKVKSLFDKLIPGQAKFRKTVSPHKKHFYSGDKVLFKAYKNNITFWEVGIIKQRICELVQGPKIPTNIIWTSSGNAVWMTLRKNTCEEPIDAIFDNFDLDTPQVSPEVRHSERKKNLRNHST